jgi:hypothetical protein
MPNTLSQPTSWRRGCGYRLAGGLYAETLLGATGNPVEDFLVDPPLPINPAAYGLAPVGTTTFERDGARYLLDWVGETHYPNVADFIEETRALGLSRRIGAGVTLTNFQPGRSRILLVHRKAILDSPASFLRTWCPKQIDDHEHNALASCAGLWWHDVVGAVDEVRTLPCGVSYRIRNPALTPVEQHYSPGVFASFPITQLAIVRDPRGHRHEPVQRRLDAAQLPYTVVEA